MFRSIFAFVAIIAVASSIWLIAAKPAHLACAGVKWTSLAANEFNIYADSNLPQSRVENIKRKLDEGKMRVEYLFGLTISNPKIILVNSKSLAEQFSLTAHGQSLLNPFSQCIVLDINGEIVDAYAHHLVHAELRHRVGYTILKEQLPRWFGERLALTVDRRVQAQPNDDSSLSFVHQSDHFDNKVLAHGLNGLQLNSVYEGLELIRQGANFNQVFKSLAMTNLNPEKNSAEKMAMTK